MLETSLGNITVEFMPDKAPNHVRNFLRLAQAGVYDGMGFHRVAKGFVIQTGYITSRTEPLSESQQRFVHNLQPEFNDTQHVLGTVSMARGDDPASADTSFFISLGPNAVLTTENTPRSGGSSTACRSWKRLAACRSTAKRRAIGWK